MPTVAVAMLARFQCPHSCRLDLAGTRELWRALEHRRGMSDVCLRCCLGSQDGDEVSWGAGNGTGEEGSALE